MAIGDDRLEFVIGAKDKFSRTMRKAELGLKDVAKGAKRAALAVTAATAAMTFGAVKLGKAFIDAGSKSQQFQVRLKSLLGSVEEGNRLFANMTEFASQVPFQFEEIMASSTQLAGVLKGGVDEITALMPLIGDLAAVSGLGVEKTTEQVIRMFSAGAASADLFRERGILAMLGFEAGVAVSAEDTRKKVIEEWNKTGSKFKGATDDLAKTWEAQVSFMQDRWFLFKDRVAKSGFLDAATNALDEFVKAIDKTMATGEFDLFAIRTSRVFVKAIATMIRAVGKLPLAWHEFGVVVDTVFLGIINGIRTTLNLMSKYIPLLAGLGLIGIDPLREMKAALVDIETELTSQIIDADAVRIKYAVWAQQAEALALKITGVAEAMANVQERIVGNKQTFPFLATSGGAPQEDEEGGIDLSAFEEELETFDEVFSTKLEEWQEKLGTFNEQMAETLIGVFSTISKGIGDSLAKSIVFGEDLGASLKNLFKQVVATVISSLIQIAVQKFIIDKVINLASKLSAVGDVTRASVVGTANMMASMALAPFPLNLTAPAVGLAHGATIGALAPVAGAAHGGLENVPSESTFLLNKGERVLSPNQNRDLTDFLGGEGGGGDINVEILPNATNADALLRMDKNDILDFTQEQIVPALQELKRKGVTI